MQHLQINNNYLLKCSLYPYYNMLQIYNNNLINSEFVVVDVSNVIHRLFKKHIIIYFSLYYSFNIIQN
jgi:hypothetical protein